MMSIHPVFIYGLEAYQLLEGVMKLDQKANCGKSASDTHQKRLHRIKSLSVLVILM